MSTYLKRAKPLKEVTLRVRTVLENELAYYFYLLTVRFRAGIIKALNYKKNGITSITEPYRVTYSLISNKRYADGVDLIVREMMESAKGLRIPLDKVKLKN